MNLPGLWRTMRSRVPFGDDRATELLRNVHAIARTSPSRATHSLIPWRTDNHHTIPSFPPGRAPLPPPARAPDDVGRHRTAHSPAGKDNGRR